MPPLQVEAHEPDLLAAAGRLGVAADRYYDVSSKGSGQPRAVAEDGRLYVLRHTLVLADDELKKLAQSDPLYGHHMLKAYIAAENRNAPEAKAELEKALTAAEPGRRLVDLRRRGARDPRGHERRARGAGEGGAAEGADRRVRPRQPALPLPRSEPRFQKSRDFTAQQDEVRARWRRSS